MGTMTLTGRGMAPLTLARTGTPEVINRCRSATKAAQPGLFTDLAVAELLEDLFGADPVRAQADQVDVVLREQRAHGRGAAVGPVGEVLQLVPPEDVERRVA